MAACGSNIMTNCCKNKTRFKSFVKQIQGNNLIPRPGFGIKLLVDLFIMAWGVYRSTWYMGSTLQYNSILLSIKLFMGALKRNSLAQSWCKLHILGIMDIISVTKWVLSAARTDILKSIKGWSWVIIGHHTFQASSPVIKGNCIKHN